MPAEITNTPKQKAEEKTDSLAGSLRSMFLNMPGLAFSKDVETGKYLACNQRFAAFANRKRIEDVAGLTDADLFDAETAARFIADDRKALEMEEPYIFYEALMDAAGTPRHFQTTKLKFTDSNGRLCILGMCADVTELYNSQKEMRKAQQAYEAARSSSVTYEHIARALASDYAYIYYVDLDTEQYISYRSDSSTGTLAVQQRGDSFFEASRRTAKSILYSEDQEIFLNTFHKETILRALDDHGVFTLNYRQMNDGVPRWMGMKISRMDDDERHIIIGISDVDAQMRYQEAAERMKEEHTTFARISALSGDMIAVYAVDPETDHYMQYSATREYEMLGIEEHGEDFFNRSRKEALRLIHPEDQIRFGALFTKENILREIETNGVFSLVYRLMLNGTPTYVNSKAAIVQEKDGPQLVVGVINVDAQTRRDQEYQRNLTVARVKANVDALTGVRNKHAYNEAEAELNRRIAEEEGVQFAVIALDVNNLKQMNDTKGHAAGDKLLKQAAAVICRIFAHSPVFRVGGDEFTVISQGEDYKNVDQLLQELRHSNEANAGTDLPVIAAGAARYEGEMNVEAVFERADSRMYVEKKQLKEQSLRQ